MPRQLVMKLEKLAFFVHVDVRVGGNVARVTPLSSRNFAFFGALDLKKKAENGEDITAFGSIC